MGGYVPFSRITAILFKMVLKVWAYSGLVLVFCFLLYYMYGGMFAILLLFFAVTGINSYNYKACLHYLYFRYFIPSSG